MYEDLIIRATRIATLAHAGQVRKYNNTPYIWHPARVAQQMSLQNGVSAIEVAAAWLHDVIEDGPTIVVAAMQYSFPPEVYQLVEEVTNPSHGTGGTREARKEIDREHIYRASRWGLMLKLFDRIDNLQELDAKQAGLFTELYCDESVLLADEIVKAPAGDNEISFIVDKLQHVIRTKLRAK